VGVFAGRVAPLVVVHHVGRTSGREYRTPVAGFAGRDDDGVVVAATALTWGRDADWCRNALAAGRYTLTRAGRDYLVDRLRLVPAAQAERIVGPGTRLTNAVTRPQEWLVGRLRRTPAV